MYSSQRFGFTEEYIQKILKVSGKMYEIFGKKKQHIFYRLEWEGTFQLMPQDSLAKGNGDLMYQYSTIVFFHQRNPFLPWSQNHRLVGGGRDL